MGTELPVSTASNAAATRAEMVASMSGVGSCNKVGTAVGGGFVAGIRIEAGARSKRLGLGTVDPEHAMIDARITRDKEGRFRLAIRLFFYPSSGYHNEILFQMYYYNRDTYHNPCTQ